MQQNKTMIMVAQRLSSVVMADQIIVLEKGRMIEMGRHFNLLRLNGRYAKLWKLQTEKNLVQSNLC